MTHHAGRVYGVFLKKDASVQQQGEGLGKGCAPSPEKNILKQKTI